jgi:hypothetical protein
MRKLIITPTYPGAVLREVTVMKRPARYGDHVTCVYIRNVSFHETETLARIARFFINFMKRGPNHA